MADKPNPAPVATKTNPAPLKVDSSTPPGVQTANAPTKPVEPQTPVDENKKPNVETQHPNAPTLDKSTDTPEKDVGQGGIVATTANQSQGKVAEPGTPNTSNPPKAALAADGGRATPSEHETTSSAISTPEAGKPLPPDDTPIPTDDELAALDDKHGYDKPVTATTDNVDEIASMRKFVQMARQLPDSTPDSGVFGGYGSVRITYGDIRNIARVSQRSFDD